MQKILLIIGLILVSATAQSQVLISVLFGDKLNTEGIEFGLEGGFNYSNIRGFDNDAGLMKFNLGYYFDIRMKNAWYFHTGLQCLYNMGMSKLSDNDIEFLDATKLEYPGDYSQNIYVFYLPMLAQYRFKNYTYLEAGPQLGWMYSSFVQFKSNYEDRNINIKDYNNSLRNWFDGGIAVGVGYKFMKGEGWSIGVRYYQGFTNVFKEVSGSRNNSIYFVCKIPIGAASKKEKGQTN
ncbi:porin family protein [Maribellus mangrovi]|uniref:porin family protein n=1 Tax=Maribellus mangrovi TaxID=3133146 RepID=UPI0030EDDC6F